MRCPNLTPEQWDIVKKIVYQTHKGRKRYVWGQQFLKRGIFEGVDLEYYGIEAATNAIVQKLNKRARRSGKVEAVMANVRRTDNEGQVFHQDLPFLELEIEEQRAFVNRRYKNVGRERYAVAYYTKLGIHAHGLEFIGLRGEGPEAERQGLLFDIDEFPEIDAINLDDPPEEADDDE